MRKPSFGFKRRRRSKKNGGDSTNTDVNPFTAPSTSTVNTSRNINSSSSDDEDDDDDGRTGHESLLKLLMLDSSSSGNSSNSSITKAQSIKYGYKRLPPEIMCRIFKYMPHYDLGCCRLVERYWNVCVANIQWTRFIIFLHGVPTASTIPNDGRHTVREETVGSPNEFTIDRLSYEDITEKFLSIQTTLTRTYQIWIYGNHVNLSQTSARQLWDFLETFKNRITHLTLIQRIPDSDPGNFERRPVYRRTTMSDLYHLFRVLRRKLEYVEFSGYMPNDQRVPEVPFPKLRKLRTLSFQKPEYRVEDDLNSIQEKNEVIIHQIVKNANKLGNVFNYPVTLNHGIIQDTLKSSKNVQAVRSFYFTSSKKQNLLICIKNLVLNNRPCSLKKLDIDPRFEVLNEQACPNIAFGTLLKSNQKSLEELKIYPLDFSVEPVEFPVLKKLKKLTVFHLHTLRFRLLPKGVDPNIFFPNLTTVDLELSMLPFSINSPSVIDEYFPPDIFTSNNNEQSPKYFSTVTELIMMKSMPATCWTKLQQLFPNVQKLELKMESESTSLRHCDIMNLIGDIWPGLKQLTMRFWKLEELEYLPITFPKTLLSMPELKILKFRFSATNAYLPWDPLPDTWTSVLLDYLEDNQLSHIRILVSCDFDVTLNTIAFIRNFFEQLEPWIKTSY